MNLTKFCIEIFQSLISGGVGDIGEVLFKLSQDSRRAVEVLISEVLLRVVQLFGVPRVELFQPADAFPQRREVLCNKIRQFAAAMGELEQVSTLCCILWQGNPVETCGANQQLRMQVHF